MKNQIKNLVCISGKITQEFERYYGPFYTSIISVERISGRVDTIPVVINYRNMKGLSVGDFVFISGELHHKVMKKKGWKNFVKVFTAAILDKEQYSQNAYLEGNVVTKFGFEWAYKKQCQLLINVQRRAEDTSDYVELYGFKTHAEILEGIKEGDTVQVEGKLQSMQITPKDKRKKPYIVLDVRIMYIKKII